MEERQACALLKARFEAAGFHVAENVMFDEAGVRFEIDGYDAAARVGYEYVTEEAGDSWDVDDAVKTALAERAKKGELHILVIEEARAPDAPTLTKLADAFLANLDGAKKKKPVARKPPPTPKKAAGKKPAKK